METNATAIPPGWHLDEESGCLVRDTIHRMGRRCRNWDYHGTGCYLVTMTLRDRSRPALGACSRIDARARFVPSELGARIEAHARRIPEFSPEIEVLGLQLMPDHLHAVLRVRRRMAKPLGEHLRGFKIGCTKIYRAMEEVLAHGCARATDSRMDARAQRGQGLFADGFVDAILFDEAAVERGLAYMADNPRRLLEKREHPEYFHVVRRLEVRPREGEDSRMDARAQGDARALWFAALGNRDLLNVPELLQVQCSRKDFAYARGPDGSLRKEAAPAVCTPGFEEKSAALLAAAEHGAVLVSPCISHGEKEIARRALAAGARLVALANKGFAPLFKPPGLLFDRCVEGRLLLLAPAGWPYMPGEKRMTREDACVLNRIAQLLCGPGAAEIQYRGLVPGELERLVEAAGRQ